MWLVLLVRLEAGHLLMVAAGDDLDEPALVEDAELALGHVDGHDLAGMRESDLDALAGDLDLAALGGSSAHHDWALGDEQGATGQPGAVQPGPGGDWHRRGQRPHQRAVGEHVHGGRLQPQRDRLPGQWQPDRDLLAGHPDGPGGVDAPVNLDRIAAAQQHRVGGHGGRWGPSRASTRQPSRLTCMVAPSSRTWTVRPASRRPSHTCRPATPRFPHAGTRASTSSGSRVPAILVVAVAGVGTATGSAAGIPRRCSPRAAGSHSGSTAPASWQRWLGSGLAWNRSAGVSPPSAWWGRRVLCAPG